ncbi:MAG: hypothetical protein ABIQ02_02175 [Saprospiraceae bacterium]
MKPVLILLMNLATMPRFPQINFTWKGQSPAHERVLDPGKRFYQVIMIIGRTLPGRPLQTNFPIDEMTNLKAD